MEKGVCRWAVDIRDWEATDEELAFCLSLLPPGETLAVNRWATTLWSDQTQKLA
jgi:hypothetical protein